MIFFKKNKYLTFQNYLQFLILMIPLFLVTGPFFPDLFLTLTSFSFLIYIFLNKKLHLFYNKTFLFFLIFLSVCIISSVLSDYTKTSLLTSIGYIRFGIFIIVIRFLINEKNNFSKNLYKVLFFIFIIFFFDSVFQKIFGFNVFGWEAPFGRITSFFYKDVKLGGYVEKFTPLLLALAIYIQESKKKIFIIFLISLTITTLSGQRMALISNLSLFFIYLFIIDLNKKKKILIFLILITGIILLILLNPVLKFRIIDSTFNQINISKNEPFFKPTKKNGVEIILHKDSTIISRVYIMYLKTSFKIWRDNLFFGSGPRTYQFKSSELKYLTYSNHAGYVNFKNTINSQIDNMKNLMNLKFKNKIDEQQWKKGHGYLDDYEGFTNISGKNNHPHNTYLQLLSETGILGTSLILGLFIYFFLKIFSSSPIYLKCLFAGLTINLFPFFLSGNFFSGWLSILYYFPIGFLFLQKS